MTIVNIYDDQKNWHRSRSGEVLAGISGQPKTVRIDEERTFRMLVVYGTKVHLQGAGPGGDALGDASLRSLYRFGPVGSILDRH
jgi:hypothetical protein